MLKIRSRVVMEHSYKYQVLISCLTYNHSTYINDALDGFCIQKTNFPYVCTIFDDASTDGEQDVLTDYIYQHFDMEDRSVARREETVDYVFFFARNKNNTNCYFAIFLLKYNHYSIKKPKLPYSKEWNEAKYIALCEGDDYWIDPLKLQKQFDYLELHSNCSFCFHPDYRLFVDGKRIEHHPRIMKKSYTTKDVILLDGGLMATGSMFFRRIDYPIGKNVPYFWSVSPVVDEPLRLYLSTKGNIGYIDEIMSVYRMASVGSWTSKTLSIRFWTDHVRGVKKMYDEFDKYTKCHFKYYILIAKFLLNIKYVKGICQTVVQNLFKNSM